MANSIVPQVGQIGNTEYINTEVVGATDPGANFPVMSKGIKAYVDGSAEEVLPAVTAEDVGKVLKVSAEGKWAVGTDNDTTYSAATESTIGLVKQCANVAEAAGDNPTAEEFKALLDALIAAGIMAEPAGG